MTQAPQLSVLLVSYESQRDLARCLPTLFAQSFTDFEVLVVDNNPNDGTARWLARTYPSVRAIKNVANTGYAGGNNLGLEHVRGRFVLLLNPDTELAPGALQTLTETAQQRPNALIGAKLLCPDGKVNACGLEMHYTGVAVCRGLGENATHYQGLRDVPLLSGAALIASSDTLRDLGGFDERYFMYLEDVDLSLRAKLRGHPLLCAADAEITHHYTQNLSPQKFFYLERNRLLTLFKIYEARTLRRLALGLLLSELATWSYALLKGPRYIGAKVRSLLWLWTERQLWLKDRLEVQRQRRVADEVLLEDSLTELPFAQLVASPRLARWLTSLTNPLYRLIYRPSVTPRGVTSHGEQVERYDVLGNSK